jgi:hypothetical protein
VDQIPGVENLCMIGGFPVEILSAKIFLPPVRVESVRLLDLCARFRGSLRLIAFGNAVQFASFPNLHRVVNTVTTAVHRFEESIGGRPYLIEVKAVSADRWRAYIVRIPGVPTALMPFYGRTPDEAAGNLSAWLTRAHQQAEAGRPV